MAGFDQLKKEYVLEMKDVESMFLVSLEHGFLLDCSNVKLKECWRPYEDMADKLTVLVENGTLREKVLELRPVDDFPTDKKQLIRLHTVFTFLTAGYLWMEGEINVPKILPRCLAGPLMRVSNDLGVKPILSYPSMILANWKIVDQHGEFDFGNLETIYQTPGGSGASWFILTHVIIEERFGPAIQAVVNAMKHSSGGNDEELIKDLAVIPKVMAAMVTTFKQIKEQVDPQHFYNKLRIFYNGWGEGKGPLPDGLVYEGEQDDKPLPMSGGSAAQSTTLQLLDSAFGVTHNDDEKEFLQNVRQYMLKEHRQFLDFVEERSNIRQYAKNSDNEMVKKAYDSCIDAMKSFRSHHLTKVKEYVKQPSEREDRNMGVEGLRDTGTGSAPYMKFLKNVNDDTANCKLVPS